MNDTPPVANDFPAEVRSRFGVLPNFFCTAASAPGLIEELWGFAKSAYLNSPLPSLFKERLFVQLSRFCDTRYCARTQTESRSFLRESVEADQGVPIADCAIPA